MAKGRVGICFPDRPDFATLLPAAKRADELGFESIVEAFAEFPHGRVRGRTPRL